MFSIYISTEEWLECCSAVYAIQSFIPRSHQHLSSKTPQIMAVTGNRLVPYGRTSVECTVCSTGTEERYTDKSEKIKVR